MDSRYRILLVLLPTILLLASFAVPSRAASTVCGGSSSIAFNFNGNSIAAGDYIWFNSVLKLKSTVPLTGLVLNFTGQQIVIVVPSGPNVGTHTLSVPDSEVIFSTSATTATTTFTGGRWVTTVPASFGDNVFLSGLAFVVPAGGFPGGISGVAWTGAFSGSAPFMLQWQWAAAVYTSFSSNYNSLGVKPTHSTTIDSYHNGDQAGTPENFTADVTGGATGGGGSNFTGSYSSTASTGCTLLVIPEYPLAGTLLAALLPFASIAVYLKVRGHNLR